MAERKQPLQQQERQPGKEYAMEPEPEFIRDSYRGSDKLHDKVAVITGGDSGIGRAVALHYAREGPTVFSPTSRKFVMPRKPANW